ncbi:MAG: alpha-glucan family phosphorylase, partial [Planctomycetes bacterium]|nr:alpha-glucan family phosphorylase [Planctomycetota bacterium]
MKVYCHAPEVPDTLRPLLDIAYNLWWVSDPAAQALFENLGVDLWSASHHNPVKMLRQLDRRRLEDFARDPVFMAQLATTHQRFQAAVGPLGGAVRRGVLEVPNLTEPVVAYFSAEFGIHESLPVYSGGLGVLAGDHVKSASDLALPFCGVGLLYRQGYFRQRFNLEGWQFELFEDMGFHDLPLRMVVNDDGSPLKFKLNLPEREAQARVWLAQVGRSALYLLDTYLLENWREDRLITNRLYDSSREHRLLQEIVLGVGGVRALKAMGIRPHRFHMNEGHSAFLVLERAAQLMATENISFEEAQRRTRPSNVFTTHTPVAAGHEVFRRELMEPYFLPQLERLRLTPEAFFALGHRPGSAEDGNFEMTSLAIRFSERINGVSKLHGEVSRRQWHCMWPDLNETQVPITHVTNGVHASTWIGPEMRQLLADRVATDWLDHIEDRHMWDRVDAISDAELWTARCKQRERLVTAGRRHADRQLRGRNVDHETLVDMSTRLLPGALTIGFARRFATYKRADLLFQHRERLAKLFENSERPIQILFAGKAHPADDGGKQLLQDVIRASRKEPFRGRIVLLEDYDMALARLLVQGCDVWLNNPRPPKEASGTSGMKACPNGALTLSTRDGWWVEGESPDNGWTIGDGIWDGRDPDDLDRADAESLISLLENEVVPLFYDLDERGIPSRWLQRARASIKSVTP